jgi:hypothetical protein
MLTNILKSFAFFWVEIKLRVLTFIVFLLKDVIIFFYKHFLIYNKKTKYI